MIAVALAALALAVPAPSIHEARHVEKAIGVPVLCFTPRAFRALEARWGYEYAGGMYLVDEKTIALRRMTCQDLAHWRTTRDPYLVALSIWTLGHELTHYEQFQTGRPPDEHEADCLGLAKFWRLKRALGITRRAVRPPWTMREVGCPR